MKTNVMTTIDVEIRKKAKAKGINLSQFLEDSLRNELKKDEVPTEDSFNAFFADNKAKSEAAAAEYEKKVAEEIRVRREQEEVARKAEYEQKREALQTAFREAWDKHGRESSEANALRDELKKLAKEYGY